MMKIQASAVAIALFFAATLTVQAQSPQYWDTNADGGAGGTGTSTPNGTWDTGITPNWNNNADGTGPTTTWTDGNDAIFSAGSDGGGDYTVTVSGAPTAHNITIEEGGNVNFTSGQITLTGTTPTITSAASITRINSALGGTAGVTLIGNGANFIDLGVANTYSGATVVGNGTVATIVRMLGPGAIPDNSVLTIANGTGQGTFQMNDGVNTYDETVRSLASTGTGTAGSISIGSKTLTINDQAGDDFTYAGLISTNAGGKVVKDGVGSWTLNINLTAFNGGEIVLNRGVLGIGQNNAFGTYAAGSTLTINPLGLPGNEVTIRKQTSGAAGSNWSVRNINIKGSFTLDLNGASNIQTTGGSSGTADVGNVDITLGADNPTITVTSTATGSSGIFILAGRILNGAGENRGFTKAGPSILNVANKGNDYRGETTIQEGTIRLINQFFNTLSTASNGPGRLGDGTGRVNLSGGILQYNGSPSLNATFTAADGPRTLTVPNPIRVTADSAISYLSTTANLGATNTIDFIFTNDSITGTGGTLTLRNEGACTDNGSSCPFRPTFSGSGFDFSRPVVISNHTSVATRSTQLNSSNTSGTQTWSGSISGTGGYRRSGAGATTFTGNNSFAGDTIVDGGTLTVSGSAATFGGGNVTVNAGSASISAGVANAILNTAKLTLLGGGAIGVADVGFISLAAGINERVGSLVLGATTFTSGTFGATGSGATNINNEYFSGAGIITVGAAGLPGDFNSDGKVDAGDYATWRKNDTANATLPNDGGAVNQASRFTLWRSNFGNPPGAGSGGNLSSGGTVPEPGTLSLLICAVVTGLIASNRRRTS